MDKGKHTNKENNQTAKLSCQLLTVSLNFMNMKNFFYAISILIAIGGVAFFYACEKEPGLSGQQTEQASVAPVHKEGEIIITIADHTTEWKPALTDCDGPGNGCAAEVTVTYVERCEDCNVGDFEIEIINPPRDIGGGVNDGDNGKVIDVLSQHQGLFTDILGEELVNGTINGEFYISSVKEEEEGDRWSRFIFEFRKTDDQSFYRATPFVCELVTIIIDPLDPEPVSID